MKIELRFSLPGPIYSEMWSRNDQSWLFIDYRRAHWAHVRSAWRYAALQVHKLSNFPIKNISSFDLSDHLKVKPQIKSQGASIKAENGRRRNEVFNQNKMKLAIFDASTMELLCYCYLLAVRCYSHFHPYSLIVLSKTIPTFNLLYERKFRSGINPPYLLYQGFQLRRSYRN